MMCVNYDGQNEPTFINALQRMDGTYSRNNFSLDFQFLINRGDWLNLFFTTYLLTTSKWVINRKTTFKLLIGK
jgi:hypothetical protein